MSFRLFMAALASLFLSFNAFAGGNDHDGHGHGQEEEEHVELNSVVFVGKKYRRVFNPATGTKLVDTGKTCELNLSVMEEEDEHGHEFHVVAQSPTEFGDLGSEEAAPAMELEPYYLDADSKFQEVKPAGDSRPTFVGITLLDESTPDIDKFVDYFLNLEVNQAMRLETSPEVDLASVKAILENLGDKERALTAAETVTLSKMTTMTTDLNHTDHGHLVHLDCGEYTLQPNTKIVDFDFEGEEHSH